MPSPFPGMDPFIESQSWRDFHSRFIAAAGDVLVAEVRPKYVVKVEEYAYLSKPPDPPDQVVEPDIFIRRTTEAQEPGGGTAVAIRAHIEVEPVVYALPEPELIRVPFLVIQSGDRHDIVTVIELLSPTNKSAGSGQRQYLQKRTNFLRTDVNVVEIDLLRAGRRLPTEPPVTGGDYFAFVSRTADRMLAEVYAWPLKSPLPKISIPLAGGDKDVLLDLQSVFTTTYERAGYDYALNYTTPCVPELSEADAAWVRDALAASKPHA